ncbi:hypothetical protein [Streptomyces mirabilis]|uniref:hypothetical protein n=1 Tax=Streptomyces mirabilis TaxID=68239 RepID=UPI003687D27B
MDTPSGGVRAAALYIYRRDFDVNTRCWAARHPIITGVSAGSLFYVIESLPYEGHVGTLPFAGAIGLVFLLTALSEKRRRRKLNLPLRSGTDTVGYAGSATASSSPASPPCPVCNG